MTPVKVSKKGAAILKNRALTESIMKALTMSPSKLYTKEGLIIYFQGKKLTLKSSK